MSTIALKTLFLKEIRRFSKVWLQTVLSPLVTTSLYFLVFGVALGSRLREISGVPYIQFVVPGLVMMTMVRDAFLNTSSSLFQSKINGTITDILVAPIGAFEMLVAYVGAAMLRAFIVGTLVYVVALSFTFFPLHHLGWTLFFAVFVTYMVRCGCHQHRQTYHKFSAFAEFTEDFDIPSHHQRKLFTNRQAQTGTTKGFGGRIINLTKALK